MMLRFDKQIVNFTFILLSCVTLVFAANDKRYSAEKLNNNDEISNNTVILSPIKGKVFAYASFEAVASNPGQYKEGEPLGQQVVTLGYQDKKGKFVSAVKFGIFDDKKVLKKETFLTPWLNDGRIDYYAGYLRENTVYDFKLAIDLDTQTMTVWYSGRGDDDWFMVAENVKLANPVREINHARIKQWPGASGVFDLRVEGSPWPSSEKIRPHRLAKKNPVVARGKGFKFQSMRSTWRKAGKQVTIARKPPVWMGFPDVVQIDEKTLLLVHNDGRQHAGNMGMFIRRSTDLGLTWSEPLKIYPSNTNCPRLQKMSDGKLLVLADIGIKGRPVVMFDSDDGGRTWTNERWLHPVKLGGHPAIVPTRVTELDDGSWLIGASYVEGRAGKVTDGHRLELYRSTDKGTTWKYWSEVDAWPPHSLDEPDFLLLPDGRLMTLTRDPRGDGYPGAKAISSDNGKTWDVKPIPFSITGRTCIGQLNDGRVMVTFGTSVGLDTCRAWIGYPDDNTGYTTQGVHFNDKYSKGLKDGALHIDNDGARGQFTQYFLRPPETINSTVEITAEVKVIANSGRAATISIPFAGKLRIFPDHVEMAHNAKLRADVTEGEFHTYRTISKVGQMQLFVDGELAFDTDDVKGSTKRSSGWDPRECSIYGPAFGNEQREEPQWVKVYTDEVTPEVTGYSIWKRVEQVTDDPKIGRYVISWSAESDGFPDQYELDNIIEIDATVMGYDHGYSGWTQLTDGRIYVTSYTDDTAEPQPGAGRAGISWLRGTFVELSDLPPVK